MASPSTTVLASGALVLVGCAVGLLLGRWTTAPAQAPERTFDSSSPQDLTPILAELRKLNETLRLQHQRGDPVAPSADRESAAPHSDTTDRLEAAVVRMDELLKRAGDRLNRTSSSIQSFKGEGYPSLDAMFQRKESLLAGGAVAGVGGGIAFQSELIRLHRLWSREDLMERYGAPSSIDAGARGLTLIYTRPNGPSQYESVYFATTDNVVAGAWGN